MGLSLWLEQPKCPTCLHSEATENENYTYNVSPMWYHIFPHDARMVEIDQMSAIFSLIKLEYALSILEKNPEVFEPLNPENGWGSYQGFMKYIKKLIAMAKEHPDWVWRSCR